MALTVAHVGCVIFRYSPCLRTETCGRRSDTRIILCSTDGGTAHPVTENHRAEGRVESVRLRRMMGTGVIADSFGDSRYVCSVFHGTRMPIGWKMDGRPRKYKEVRSTSRRYPDLDVRSLTYSLGDLKWKAWGVTAEPEVKTKLIESQRWCKPYLTGCGV